MKSLNRAGYKAVSLAEFTSMLSGGENVSPRTIVISFDDGFQNFYSNAYPVLSELDFKATVFLVTDFCGKYNDWAGNPANLGRSKLLDWSEVRELSECGIEFGSHTRTHPDLTKISSAEVEGEVAGSKAAIEDSIGREVRTFAYPYGKFNSSVRQITEKSFRAACSTNLGKVRLNSDIFSLKRIDSYYLRNLKVFEMLASTSFDRYLEIRQGMRIVKSLIY